MLSHNSTNSPHGGGKVCPHAELGPANRSPCLAQSQPADEGPNQMHIMLDTSSTAPNDGGKVCPHAELGPANLSPCLAQSQPADKGAN